MAANKVGKRLINKTHSPSRNRDSGQAIQRRQARVTVKYDRKELQKRLDVEKWIDERIEHLYEGREVDMPDEVNIDDLLDLETDEQRRSRLQMLLRLCKNNTEEFIRDLLFKLKGLQKQTLLRKNGLEVSKEEPILEHA
ncbi:PREDICTED: protein phosphatase 1 regulatory subunit 14A [Nanorana parkeri]|uniref:protein phosphatase 1 regulatory subunit 14A n=1 Tax=Nanorana parkeri TaxID=125878 RepID=UPI000854400C|nr:PREDICTED: protein phosphatase 1 regulatory subunit 14A [Nanorana parkeri]